MVKLFGSYFLSHFIHFNEVKLPAAALTVISLSLNKLFMSLILCVGAPSCIKLIGWQMPQKESDCLTLCGCSWILSL